MRICFLNFLTLLVLAFTASEHSVAAPSLVLEQHYQKPVGLHFETLQDVDGLSWRQALEQYRLGRYQTSVQQVPNFGLDAGGYWLMARLSNPSNEARLRYLLVDNAWLDYIELYQIDDNYQLLDRLINGDQYPRSVVRGDDVNFVFRLRVPAGESYILLRIETPDPSPIPLRFFTHSEYESFQDMRMFSYGACLGFIVALMAYNFMLFVGLREKSHLSYSAFLAAFILMATAYTGYGMHYFYPASTQWAQWSHPIHMMLYGSCGLLFASTFLKLREQAPRVHWSIISVIGFLVVATALSYWFGLRALLMKLTFVFAVSYSLAMISLGFFAVKTRGKGAYYFLVAVIIGALGAASTTLACLGAIPFNEWTFRGVEMGLLIEATLLALALAARFAEAETQSEKMRELAYQDGLTGLSNRRAFAMQSSTLWNSNLRAGRPLCVIMLDIDNFKTFNDSYGHAAGDKALCALGELLSNQARKGDVTARLGGEEFVVLLPDTSLGEATQIAERLRARVSAMVIEQGEQSLRLTCSLGVVESSSSDLSVEQVIERADSALYHSKHKGRNQVTTG
ncbi:MAG: diguanylate cyclase [Cellvibrionaceae bacterium]